MNWLSSIQEFADQESQRRLWLGLTIKEQSSFVECLCCYFDDLRLSLGGYKWAIEEGLVSQEEAGAVAQFHQIADAYKSPAGDYDHEAILADPKWAEVVEAAKRAQAALMLLIHDPCEQRLLIER